MSKIVAIGDIHGHFDQLMELWHRLIRENIDPKQDTLVFLGDYVDGGPKTKDVLDQLMDWKIAYPHWKFLFGNHESLLLDAFNKKHPIYGDYYLWWGQGGKETLNSFKPSSGFSEYELAIMPDEYLITKSYLDFMRGLDLYYETDDYFFIHAGVYPNRSLEDHKKAVGEFHPDLMREGDMAYDMIWIREQFIESDYDWGKKIIFGHTVSRDFYPIVKENKIGLDTMMHNSGRLSAVILPEENIIQTGYCEE